MNIQKVSKNGQKWSKMVKIDQKSPIKPAGEIIPSCKYYTVHFYISLETIYIKNDMICKIPRCRYNKVGFQ
jgi:hypothetical protein